MRKAYSVQAPGRTRVDGTLPLGELTNCRTPVLA